MKILFSSNCYCEEALLCGAALSLPSSRRRPGPSTTNESPKGSVCPVFGLDPSFRLDRVFVVLGPGLRRDDGRGENDGCVDFSKHGDA